MSKPVACPILDSRRLSDLIDVLGTSAWAGQLLLTLSPSLRCEHLSAFVFDATLHPHQIMAQSLGSEPVAERAGQLVRSEALYRFDPNLRVVRAANLGGNEVLTTRQRAVDISEQAYALGLYKRFGLVDRLSLLSSSQGRWFVLSIYRSSQAGEFEPADCTAFEASAGLLAAMLRRHLQWMPPAAWRSAIAPDNAALEQRLQALPSRLSLRERQVCARALRGVANPGIALDLGVQVSTVSTLRRRAFAKLGISTLGELYVLCLWRGDAS